MEVIRKGKPESERTALWTCTGCSARIRSKVSEGKEHSDYRDGNVVITKCPECEKENWVDKDLFC